MKAVAFLERLYYKILISIYGGISFKELMDEILITFGICESYIDVSSDVYKNKIDRQLLVELKDYKKLFVVKSMNRYERNITKSILDGVNTRLSKAEHKSYVEKTQLNIEQYMEKLSIYWLSFAESLALLGGLFVLAGKIRQVATDKLIKKYEKKKKIQYYDVRRLYSIYLSLAEQDKAVDVLKRAGYAYRKSRSKICREMELVARGGSLEEFSTLMIPDGDNDKLFYEMVYGKNIAIIAPSPGKFNVSEILNEFDLVIRINYIGTSLLNENCNTCRVDISYYSSECGKILSKMSDLSFIKDLKIACFRNVVFDYEKNLIAEGKARARVGCVYKYMFQGFENVVQLILMDLFHFSPARIKVFNANLYLTQQNKIHEEGYIHKKFEATININFLWHAYAAHNLISNYEITKYLYDIGYFEADDELKSVLSLGTKEYLRRMEQLT